MAKYPSTKTITTEKGTAAYAWVDRKSIKFDKYEITLRQTKEQLDALRAEAQKLVEENLSPKKQKLVKWAPFNPMKDKDTGDDVLVIKARSGYAPTVFNAKGVELKYPPKVGPGSVVKVGLTFEVQERDDIKVVCRFKSLQIIKLVEYVAGGGDFGDESDDEEAYTGSGGEKPAEEAKAATKGKKKDEDDDDDAEGDATKF